MAHHEPPLSPQPGDPAAQTPVDATVPVAPAQPEAHDAAAYPGAQPAPGWGATQQGPEPIYPQQPGQQQPGQPQWGWGAPPPTAPGHGQRSAGDRWRGLSTAQKGLAAGAVAVVIAGGAGAAVWAANSANTANSANSANGQPGANGFNGQAGPGGQAGQNGANGFGAPGGTRGQGFGAGGLGVGMMGEVLHGEFVVVRNNATVTMVEQTGTVTAVSAQSVTVKSSDGFVQTYALSSSTQYASRGARGQSGTGGSQQSSTLAQGQTVTVSALKDGLAAQTILIQGTGSGSSTN